MSAANLLEIEGYQATIQYDSEIEMFRGEFIGLTGGADFIARGYRSRGGRAGQEPEPVGVRYAQQ